MGVFPVNITIVDCSLESINIIKPDVNYNITMSVSSPLYSLDMTKHFVSSVPDLCPLSKFNITYVNSTMGNISLTNYTNFIKMGTQNTKPKEKNYIGILHITDISKVL